MQGVNQYTSFIRILNKGWAKVEAQVIPESLESANPRTYASSTQGSPLTLVIREKYNEASSNSAHMLLEKMHFDLKEEADKNNISMKFTKVDNPLSGEARSTLSREVTSTLVIENIPSIHMIGKEFQILA